MADEAVSAPVVIDSGSHTCKVGFAGDDHPKVIFPTVVGHMENNDPSAVIIDNGSGTLKAGFSGEDQPRVVFPTIIGHSQDDVPTVDQKEFVVGNYAQENRGALFVVYPIEEGIIRNWDDMEKIWEHTFAKELCVDPEKYDCLVTETPLNSKPSREKLTEIIFERFDVRSIYVAVQPVMALYHSGRTTGLVVDCGDTACHTVPIYEGYNLPHAIQKLNIGGRDIDMRLYNFLHERHQFLKREHAHEIKENFGFVALDYEQEKESSSRTEQCYELPDGSVIIGNESFDSPEILFQPSLIGKENPGIHSLTWSSMMKCDVDIRVKDLSHSIVLTGGTTMFSGFSARLEKEVLSLAPPLMDIKITAPPDRKYGAWNGGSLLASLSTFQCMWVSKEEYVETGPSIVHKKCF